VDEPFAFSAFEDADAEQKPKRGGSRDSMMLAATMMPEASSAPEIALRVRNVAPGGIMADCAEPIGRGTKVLVTLRNIGPVNGVVAWARDGRIGVAFDRSIDPKLARKPVGQGKPVESYLRPVRSKRPPIRTG
jgi:hypothetical protein